MGIAVNWQATIESFGMFLGLDWHKPLTRQLFFHTAQKTNDSFKIVVQRKVSCAFFQFPGNINCEMALLHRRLLHNSYYLASHYFRCLLGWLAYYDRKTNEPHLQGPSCDSQGFDIQISSSKQRGLFSERNVSQGSPIRLQ